MNPEQEAQYAKAMEEFDHDPVEENFWDDRTTPLAYSRTDSENELERLRAAREQAWAEGFNAGVHGVKITGSTCTPYQRNPYKKEEGR